MKPGLPPEKVSKRWAIGALTLLLGAAAGTVFATSPGRALLHQLANRLPDIPFVSLPEKPPDPPPSSRRPTTAVVGAQALQLNGAVNVKTVALGDRGARPPADTTRLHYTLQAPITKVWDADIRGFLDGSVKYDFNQGTANHMRVGRRYNGPYGGRFELKRSLVRWQMPELPSPSARVVDAEVRLWAEPPDLTSPLSVRSRTSLDLVAYPLSVDWAEGSGGRDEDSFSPAKVGEVEWREARRGKLAWPSPGALATGPTVNPGSYMESPLAISSVRLRKDASTQLSLRSKRLADHVARRSSAEDIGLLLKLDDVDEDRFATEFGILTSQFGERRDHPRKTPALQLEMEAIGAVDSLTVPFVLETGGEMVLPAQRHGSRRTLLSATIHPDSSALIPPQVFVRGGKGRTDTLGVEWERMHNPILTEWDWSQIKVSTRVNFKSFGGAITLRLNEFWVKPGPREDQVPQVLFVAPSGDTIRKEGVPAQGTRYEVAITPDEVGLWRYGWCFRAYPEMPPGSHCGRGVVFVGLNAAQEGEISDGLARLLRETTETLRGAGWKNAKAIYQLNSLMHLLSRARVAGHISDAEAERMRSEALRLLPTQ